MTSLAQILLSTLVNVTSAVFLACVPAVNAALRVCYDYKNPLIISLGYSGLSESRYKRVLQWMCPTGGVSAADAEGLWRVHFICVYKSVTPQEWVLKSRSAAGTAWISSLWCFQNWDGRRAWNILYFPRSTCAFKLKILGTQIITCNENFANNVLFIKGYNKTFTNALGFKIFLL